MHLLIALHLEVVGSAAAAPVVERADVGALTWSALLLAGAVAAIVRQVLPSARAWMEHRRAGPRPRDARLPLYFTQPDAVDRPRPPLLLRAGPALPAVGGTVPERAAAEHDGAAERPVVHDRVVGDGSVIALPLGDEARRPLSLSASEPARADETLQLLPGRLEVLGGLEAEREIRFVRTSGDRDEVTLGRLAGPPHRHVQLAAETVSRMHAVMQYGGGRWRIRNLSPTNPLLVNGEELHDPESARELADGDVLELGEVTLRYRDRA